MKPTAATPHDVIEFSLTLAGLMVAMLLIIGILYFAQLAARRDRLRNSGINFWTVALTCSILTFVVTMLIYTTKRDASYALGVMFGVMSLLMAILFRYERFFKNRSVGIVLKSRSNFVQALGEAASRGLKTTSNFDVKASTIDAVAPLAESVEHQVQLLRSPGIRELDALIVIPSSSDEIIAVEIASLVSRGVYVVCCDIKPNNRHFFERSLFPPAFVGSDCGIGGRLIGEAMGENCAEDELFVVLSGPSMSAPGRARAQAVLTALRRSVVTPSIHEVAITSWNPDEVCGVFQSEIAPLLAVDRPRSMFCANDEICRMLSNELYTNLDRYGKRWRLYGYDGLRDSSGTLLVRNLPYVVATVDQKVGEIGAIAARFVDEHYRRINNEKRRRVILEPTLIRF
ncbi:sugar ABC transporter substrate-binding protein [Aquabacterium sp.]|uniref:sugar ABC transporter substrate-binding protein n=1 Tax=Aquabacterium sp. TaxID=1872578 RepID=UPI003D6C9261